MITTNKVIEAMTNDKEKNSSETLSIEGNLRITGKISASSYGNININNNDKICIGDKCLTKNDLYKLLNYVKK